MASFAEVRAFARSPLARREARAAGSLPQTIALYALAAGIALVLAAAAWVLLFLQAHCSAAIALYCSARIRQVWLASLAAYGLVLGPQLGLACLCLVGFVAPFLMVSTYFDRLVNNFDGYALGEPLPHRRYRMVPRSYSLPPPPQKVN